MSWKIADVERFLRSVRTIPDASARLGDMAASVLAADLGGHDLVGLIAVDKTSALDAMMKKVTVRIGNQAGKEYGLTMHQAIVPPEETLNSVMAGIVIHRRGQLKYRFRAGGREFARSVADIINKHRRGVASVFLYEEAFGRSDRIHWLIHLRDLSVHDSLIDMRAAMTPEVAEVYSRQGIPKEGGSGDWSRTFLDATLEDVALTLTAQHWNMYAKKTPDK